MSRQGLDTRGLAVSVSSHDGVAEQVCHVGAAADGVNGAWRGTRQGRDELLDRRPQLGIGRRHVTALLCRCAALVRLHAARSRP